MIDLILRKARIEERPEIVDIAVDEGLIVAIDKHVGYGGREEIALDGRVVLPGFVNPHVHLDKAFVGNLAPSGIMLEGVAQGRRLKSRYTKDDVKIRAQRAVDLAIRHGTTAIRSVVDVDPIVGTLCVEALAELRDAYRDRVDLQILAFPQEGFLGVDGMDRLLQTALGRGADVVGGRPHGDPPEAIDFERHIREIFSIAEGRPVDMSVDALFPSEPFDAHELALAKLADATLAGGHSRGTVTAHHALALSAADPVSADSVITRVQEAGVNVITLPTSNLFTEGRLDDKNQRRGLTRVKDLLKGGVNVAFGTDNLDDTYLPFANIDPLLEAHVCAAAAHLGTVEERRMLVRMATHNGARILGIEDRYGIEIGRQADLVVLDTLRFDAIVTEQPEKVYVCKAGRIVLSNECTTIVR